MPSLSGFAAYMKSFMGKAVAIDKYGFMLHPQWIPKVIAKVAAYTCLVSESGSIFTTFGATAAVTFTLPAIDAGNGDGWILFFYAGADFALTVAAETVDTLSTYNDATADSVAFQTGSQIMGGAFAVISDGTQVFAIPLGSGGEPIQTVTVAS